MPSKQAPPSPKAAGRKTSVIAKPEAEVDVLNLNLDDTKAADDDGMTDEQLTCLRIDCTAHCRSYYLLSFNHNDIQRREFLNRWEVSHRRRLTGLALEESA